MCVFTNDNVRSSFERHDVVADGSRISERDSLCSQCNLWKDGDVGRFRMGDVVLVCCRGNGGPTTAAKDRITGRGAKEVLQNEK